VKLAETLQKLTDQFAKFKALRFPTGMGRTKRKGFRDGRLSERKLRASNPGRLRMLTYLPANLPDAPALVVVLHGGLQTAAYDLGAGWSTLADRYGIALLMPEQQRSNNALNCFNWFLPEDSERGKGEALSISQMIKQMRLDHGIDPSRIFITGLSAGGAMTSVMLATYPEVFAGGAIIAGLPYAAAATVQEAFHVMAQARVRSSRTWGDRVRQASPHQGPWPKVSVWHGSADETVSVSNADEIIKQWTDLHGLSLRPTVADIVDGIPRHVWSDAQGEVLIESYTVTGMGHGTPLATGHGDQRCGAVGPYLLEAGISSSYHIAKFFGVADTVRNTANAHRGVSLRLFGSNTRERTAHRSAAEAEGTGKRGAAVDIGAVIAKALTAAGLMKPQ